jgi:hypothetical protein
MTDSTGLFPERIETERLRLAAITEETNALELYEYLRAGAPGIEDTTQYVTWDPHETPRETQQFVDEVAQSDARTRV